jgi:ABC-type transport system substrate-binding protein
VLPRERRMSASPAAAWRTRARAARVGLLAALACAVLASGAAFAADPARTLRIAQFDLDTLDPHQYTDDPSFQVVQALFEPAYEWDYLAKVPTLAPLTAAALPEVTDEGRVWIVRLQRGILFHDDPVFKGKPRELTADDYVYAYKRWLDPNGRRGGSPILTGLIVGAREVVDAARKDGRFDFDRPIEGLRSIDRYTLRIALREPNYPNVRELLSFVGALPREVVDDAKGDIRTRPVGTGPYRLKEWKRGSRVVLVAHPGYREAGFPASRDPADASLVAAMKGKRVPFAGTVEISIVDEDITRLLLFEKGDIDFVQLRGEIATRLTAGDSKLKPEYAARGIARHVFVEPFLFSTYFNLKDPVIGGMGNDRVALRRAVAMSWDADTAIKVVLAGGAIPAGQLIPPGVAGHDPALPAKSIYDPGTANALLDRVGYGKRDRAGFRLAPDGSPLMLTVMLRTGGASREFQMLWKRSLEAIGVRGDFKLAPFQEVIKDLENGKYQMYQGGFGGAPSGYNIFAQLHSVQPQRVNVSQFANADYDRAAEAFLRAAGERDELTASRRMNEISRALMPFFFNDTATTEIYTQPWLIGYRPMVFSSYWKYLDVDLARRK